MAEPTAHPAESDRRVRRKLLGGTESDGETDEAPNGPPSLKQRALCIAAPLIMFQSSLVIGTSLLFPLLPLLAIPQAWARDLFCRGANFVEAAWLGMAVTLLRYCLGIRIVFHVEGASSPDKLVGTEDVVIIANHRTRLDWMFLWALGGALNRFGGLKIVLKDNLRKVPGFGWATQCFGFAFMTRGNKEADLSTLGDTVRLHSGRSPAILIFPEGTDLSEDNKAKNKAFVEKNGLPLTEQVLHPRTAGFEEIWAKSVDVCKSKGRAAPTLLDATLCYVDYTAGERPSESSMFKDGRPCREVHIFLKKVTPTPGTAAESQELIKRSFVEKEDKLKKAYANMSAGARPDLSVLATPTAATLQVEQSCAGTGMALGSGLVILVELLMCYFLKRAGITRGSAAILVAMGAFGAACSFSGGIDRVLIRHMVKNP